MAESDPRRAIPSVQRVVDDLGTDLPSGVRLQIARDSVAEARRRAESGEPVETEAVIDDARARLGRVRDALLQPVVNATGVLLHTNLGRAPIGADALAAMGALAGYGNLEYRLDDGERGSRHDHAGNLVAQACGAEAGIVVNNNAAAVLLVLATLARNRDVIVSRGELVEIGGGFRVPEIMAETRARLVEVGTTNRTRLADYANALTAEAALSLKVHASNYRMIGFVEATSISELATLGLPVMVDAGSGLLDEATPWLAERPEWLHDEPGVRQCLEAGAAIVTFSGDKLFGGPQAGVIVGRADLVHRCTRHPLARAMRADKLTLAGIQSVALSYLAGDGAAIPLWRLATAPVEHLRARAERVARDVPGAKIVDTEAATGGGSLPGFAIASVGVSVEVDDADLALAALRRARIIALARNGAVVCDLRTVDPEHRDDEVATALRALVTQ